jgi:hypothetical protein
MSSLVIAERIFVIRGHKAFVVRLTAAEREQVVANCDHLGRLKFAYTMPYAFTEHARRIGFVQDD